MQSEASKKFRQAPKTAIVLGTQGVGDLICESLKEEGFVTEFAPSEIQRFASIGWAGSSPDDLRSTLRKWIGEKKKTAPDHSLWLHPGVSPWAERPELPTVGQELGIQVIGPPSKVLSLYGNRLTLLGEAEKLSIPSLSLSPNPFHSVREIEKLIKTHKLKLPFVLKAVRGGSGYGIRVIHHPEDLGRSLGLWLEQLQRNVGEVILLAERYLEGARRIVQPFARFSNGQAQLFPSMDVSLTCRFRKLVEFCPADETTDPHSLKTVRDWSEALIHRTGYVGVGSFEFLLDGKRGYLIEGIPRLNTSYFLWEKVAGTSAIAWQLATLQGNPDLVPPKNSKTRVNSALSLRFYAEDPILQLPQPGKLTELSEERQWDYSGASVRFIPSVKVGQEITGAYDVDAIRSSLGAPEVNLAGKNPLESHFGGLLGHLWVGGSSRKNVIQVAKGVLDQIWIAGSLQTNERFLQEILSHPWVQEGMFHASFIDEEFIPAVRPPLDLFVRFIGLAQLAGRPIPPHSPVKWVVGDQWMKPLSQNLEWDWKQKPEFFEANGMRGVSGSFVMPEGRVYRFLCYPTLAAPDEKWLIRIGGWVFAVRRVLPKATSGGVKPLPKLNALVSGRIHSMLFREGAWVQAHDNVLVIESLGSLVPHALPVDVRLSRWLVGSQEQVVVGQALAELETVAVKS